MSDFFSRLAERTLGMEPAARPDLAPVVSPVMEKENVPLSAREDAASTVAWEEPVSQFLERRADSIPESEAWVSRRERVGSAHRAVQSSSVFVASDPHRRPQTFASVETHRGSIAAGEAAERAMPAEKNAPAMESTKAAHFESAVALPMPQRVTQSEAPSLERFTAAAPPTIHVSIGRIDVRAVTAPSRPAASERRPSRLSLEQYLRERNEGRR